MVDGSLLPIANVIGLSPQMRLAATATGDPEGVTAKIYARLTGTSMRLLAHRLRNNPQVQPTRLIQSLADPSEPYFWTPRLGSGSPSSWVEATGTVTLTIQAPEPGGGVHREGQPDRVDPSGFMATGSTVFLSDFVQPDNTDLFATRRCWSPLDGELGLGATRDGHVVIDAPGGTDIFTRRRLGIGDGFTII